MLLGEIKLMALRLMFSDTDITYDIAHMEQYLSNNNTREKLIRMNDSINRALNLYYQRVGLRRGSAKVNLVASGDEFTNTVNIATQIPTIQNVLKVRIISSYYGTITNADFEFDGTTLVLSNLPTTISTRIEENIIIEVFYEHKMLFVPSTAVDATFDLDTINVPVDVQMEIPKFVKGELYEEDEPQMALYAKNEFANFLALVKKPYVIKQQKVVRPNWNK